MENKVTINSLSGALSQATGKSKKLCEDFLREFFKLAAESLESGETLRIKGFGTFKTVDVESRTGVNVNTGEKQEIPAHKKVVFTPAKEMSTMINSPFEEFESMELEDDMPEDVFDVDNDAEEESGEEVEYALPDAGTSRSESLINENEVSDEVLEVGSDEENEDDVYTYKAYTEIEAEQDSPSKTVEKEEARTAEQPSPVYATAPEHEVKKEVYTEAPVPQLPVYEDGPERKSRFGLGFLVGSLSTFAVCAVVFMLGCFLDWWPVNFGYLPQMKTVAVQEVPVDTQQTEATEQVEEPQPEAEPVYDTVSTTRYLTTIAREHYGNFNFWPYIYEANQSILGHPDRITPGTKVVVPDLEKLGVDPKDKDDIATAKKKGLEIYARFR